MPTFTVIRETPTVLPIKEVIITLTAEEIREILQIYGAAGTPASSAFSAIVLKLRELQRD